MWPFKRLPEFEPFESIPRLTRPCIITEKIDGTNGCVRVEPNGRVLAGSRNGWITPEQDNHGFAAWVKEHEAALRTGLGVGSHFGEWWGGGIGKRYKSLPKRFSLFNVSRWRQVTSEVSPGCPSCCSVVPILYKGMFTTDAVEQCIEQLRREGSVAAPGCKAEGVVIFHIQGRLLFKKTLLNDEVPKSQQ